MKIWQIAVVALALFGAAAPIALQASEALSTYRSLKAQPIGQTRLTWLAFDVYDAKLYGARPFRDNQPFVLELSYLRALNGTKVAEKSLEEMRRLGLNDPATEAQWLQTLSGWFADIQKGTKLAGIRLPDGRTAFIRDGVIKLGVIEDPRFAELFFGIWLDEQTSRPDLRAELLGLSRLSQSERAPTTERAQ